MENAQTEAKSPPGSVEHVRFDSVLVMRKLREVFDRCDVEGQGRVSRTKLLNTVRGNAWLSGFFKLPQDSEAEPVVCTACFGIGGGSGECACGGIGDRVTWAEFSAQSTKWQRALVVPAKRSNTPSRSPPIPGAPASLTAPSERGLAAGPADLRFANWTERASAQHRQARSWLLAQAAPVPSGGPVGSSLSAVAAAAQLRALARDIDAQVLCAVAPGPSGVVPSTEARTHLVLPYVELLRGDTLQDLKNQSSGGAGALAPPGGAGASCDAAGQAEAVIRACIVQLERALMLRLTALREEEAVPALA